MSRGRDIEQPGSTRKPDDERPVLSPGRGGSGSSEPKPETERDESRRSSRPVHIRHRDRDYLDSIRHIEIMAEIGRFRTGAANDLEQFMFNGKRSRMEYELRRLAGQGLIRRRNVRTTNGEKFQVYALTREGKRLVERSGQSTDQEIYADVKKPAEIRHDAAIYMMCQAEAAKIRSSGGKIRRVVLDYELKKRIYSPLARARQLHPEEYRALQVEIARANGLKVVDDRIPLPDLRIEYQSHDGERAKVDLEVATEHYNGRDDALAQALCCEGENDTPVQADFVTHRLAFDYDLFELPDERKCSSGAVASA